LKAEVGLIHEKCSIVEEKKRAAINQAKTLGTKVENLEKRVSILTIDLEV